jgi:hypothetical protein
MAYAFDDDNPLDAMYRAPAPAQPTILPNVTDLGAPAWEDPDRPGLPSVTDLVTSDAPAHAYGEPAAAPEGPAPRKATQAEIDAITLQDAGLKSLAAQQKARGLRPGEVPAEELAALRAAAGREQFGEAFGMAGQRIVTTRANPRFPSTQKYGRTMLGTRREQQAVGPDGQPLFETRLVEEPIVGADGQPMRRSASSRRRSTARSSRRTCCGKRR